MNAVAWDADAILSVLLVADVNAIGSPRCAVVYLPTRNEPRRFCGPALKRVAACRSCKGAGRIAGTSRGFSARVKCGCRNGFIDLGPFSQLCVVPATAEQMATLPAGQILFRTVVAPGFDVDMAGAA